MKEGIQDIPMVEFSGVTKTYPQGVTALDDVFLTMEKGEFCFLTGPSGSGKSTLLKLIYLAERPTKGDIFIGGINLNSVRYSNVSTIRRKIGIIFQDFKLLLDRTVFENVALALEVAGFSRDQVAFRVDKVLESLGLGGKGGRYPLELSAGEQQRVAIARAIVNRPPVILADEPTGNLDLERTMEVLGILEELNARGATVLFATHDERLLKGTPRRTFRLRDGKLDVISQ